MADSKPTKIEVSHDTGDKPAEEKPVQPVIVKRALIKEPEPEAKQVDEPAPEVQPLIQSGGKPDLKPSAELVASKKAEADKQEPKNEAPESAAETPETGDEPAGKDEEKTPETPEQAEEAEAARQAEHDAAIQKLADSKQYYLQINAVEKRRTKRFVVLGALLSVLLAGVWLDVALDSGILSVSGLPHTHYFGQPAPAAATSTSVAVPAYDSFSTKLSKLTVRYPASWKLSDQSSAAMDNFSLAPGVNNSDAHKGIINLSFVSPAVLPPPAGNSYTVESASYQKLAHQVGQTIYLRDLVYADAQKNIYITSSLSNDNSTKAGQTIGSLSQLFLDAGGQASSQFEATVTRTPAFTTVQQAKQFINTAAYQQARSILLSTAPAKP